MKTLTLALTILLAHAAAQPAAPLQHGGKTYKTVQIGTQTWMAENLNHEAEGSVCYDNNPDNCAKYGRLYDWETAMKVCPKGWHLPSNDDWDKLLRFVDRSTNSKSLYESETAGKHLKAKNSWNSYIFLLREFDGNGTDYDGFSALPGGLSYSDGSFYGLGNFGYWWCASEGRGNSAYRRKMSHNLDDVDWSNIGKSSLLSVRCVQD